MADIALIRHYLFIKQCRCENDIENYSQYIWFRSAEPYDHLEMIMLKARLQMCEEICRDIFALTEGFHGAG